jgi:hypothetical protein
VWEGFASLDRKKRAITRAWEHRERESKSERTYELREIVKIMKEGDDEHARKGGSGRRCAAAADNPNSIE